MKNKLDDYSKARIEATEAFLASFLIREKLAAIAMPEDDCTISEDITLGPMNMFNPFPWEGQVRLLSQMDQPTYVLLARRWGNDAFLVIPFSQYSDPATNMELKTAKDAGAYLQVLQIWNARTLQAETLRKSWLTGRMNDRDIKDALALWEYSVGGKQPGKGVLERTGVPIFHKDDPRIRYQDAVLGDFAKLDAEDLEIASRGKGKTIPVIKPLWGTKRLAAGEKNATTIRRSVCRVKGFAGEVEIVYSAARKRLALEVFDSAGNTSQALDGWRFLYHDGTDFGVIAEGRVEADKVSECSGACCLLDTEGDVRVLMPKKGK